MLRTNQRGFALISVLIFFEIFALLTLFTLRSANWEIKQTDAYFNKNQLSKVGRTILQNVENLTDNPDCQIVQTSAYQLSLQPIMWWESHSCVGKFNLFQYYYVVEALADDPCASIASSKGAYYTRVTLMVVPLADASVKLLLQSTTAHAALRLEHCESGYHSLTAGEQSLREIIY